MRFATLPSILLCAMAAQAQVTLEFNDLVASGVQTNMYLLTSGAPSAPPSDGVNQSWNITGATWQPIGTMHFRPATGTPYAASYPAANWAWEFNFTGIGIEYLYMQIDNTGVYVVADRVPNATVNYPDTKKVLQFPMTFGNSFSDLYEGDSGPATVTWSYSGHGTLLTTLGNYPDLAKVASNESDIVFWNKAPLYPMVVAMSSSIRAFVDPVTAISEVNGGRTVLAYPNPCTDRLMIDGVEAAGWRITDLNGRTVRTGSFAATGVLEMDIAGLESGSYLFLSDAGTGLRMVRFSKL